MVTASVQLSQLRSCAAKPGQKGRDEFIANARAIFDLQDDELLELNFGCKVPGSPGILLLEGTSIQVAKTVPELRSTAVTDVSWLVIPCHDLRFSHPFTWLSKFSRLAEAQGSKCIHPCSYAAVSVAQKHMRQSKRTRILQRRRVLHSHLHEPANPEHNLSHSARTDLFLRLRLLSVLMPCASIARLRGFRAGCVPCRGGDQPGGLGLLRCSGALRLHLRRPEGSQGAERGVS